MTKDEAELLLAQNFAELPLKLRDCNDAYAAARKGYSVPALLDGKHNDFLKGLAGKTTAEQLLLAQDHLSMLGKILLAHDLEKQAATVALEKARKEVAAAEAARRERERYVAMNTPGILGALQTLQFRINGVMANLGLVSCPADLASWWSDFESFLDGARGSVAAEISARGVEVVSASKRAA